MLLVGSDDADTSRADFARTGISASPVLPFSRAAVLADGSTTTIGFELAFARDPLSPRTGFAACAHRNPKAFWNTAFQQHGNGVTRMGGVVFTAKRPQEHAGFFRALTSCDDIDHSDQGIMLRTPRGEIEVLSEESFALRTGLAPAGGEGAVLRALRFAAPKLTVAEEILRDAGIAAEWSGTTLVVPPQAAFGATLLFEEEGAR